MSASIKKKYVSQNRTKYCNKQNKTNKRPFFLPKINKYFWAQFYKIWRKGFGHIFLKMILLTSRKRCRQAKRSIFSGRWSKTQNSNQDRIYPSLTLQTAKFVSLKRVLNKYKFVAPSEARVTAIMRGSPAIIHYLTQWLFDALKY